MALTPYEEYLYGKLKFRLSLCILACAVFLTSVPIAVYGVVLFFNKHEFSMLALLEALPYILFVVVALLFSWTWLTLGAAIKAILQLSKEVETLRENALELKLRE